MKNIFTRFGGANNCLRLIVTTDELRMSFPFALLAEPLDLEHRVRKQDIISLKEEYSWLLGARLTIDYRREDGLVSRIEIRPRRIGQFKSALMSGSPVAIP